MSQFPKDIGESSLPTGNVRNRLLGSLVDGRYKILEELARDERGVIYLALVMDTREVVDLRFVRLGPSRLAEDDSRRRFEREVNLLGRLRDPHVVRLYSYGEYGGSYYVVFEHLSGISLRKVIDLVQQRSNRSGRCLKEDQAIRVIRQVAYGLRYAHQHQVIHRGLCPEAINIDNDGLVQIVDFRFAKGFDSIDLTEPGAMPNRASDYLAPEQSQGTATFASDIYALGMILGEMLTGEIPSLEKMGCRSNPSTLEHLLSHVSPGLAALITKCLDTEPSSRPTSADAFLQELDTLIERENDTAFAPISSGQDITLSAMVEEVSKWRLFTTPQDRTPRPQIDSAPAAMAPSSTLPKAWIDLGNGRTVPLNKPLIRIGRTSARENIFPDIAFDDKWVHRRYVKIEYRSGAWHLSEEAGARHGTSVNSVPLGSEEIRKLNNGDVVTLGQGIQSLSFTFHCE